MSTAPALGPTSASDAGPSRARPGPLSKVPEITALFWVIKVLTTGMGEAGSDWLLNRGEGLPGLGLPGALAIDVGLFVVAFVLQFSVRRYVPAVYWLAVAAVSILGTVFADVTHFLLGVPLWATIAVYAGVLVVNFLLWHRSEKTLSIHSITTRRREIHYWVTVFSTFALGTAVGDLTASVWKLGFLASGVLFLVLILVPAVAHLRFGAGAVLTFWTAYVLTRPLGASFADWLAVVPGEGGLDYGAGTVTLVSSILIVALVGWVAWTHRRRAGARTEGGPSRAAARSR